MNSIALRSALMAATAVVVTSQTHAANLAVGAANPLTTTITVGSGNYFQMDAAAPATLAINSGGKVAVTGADFETIIGQNWSGTSTINLNAGGSLDFSGATGNGRTLYIGNNIAAAIGIVNVQGGSINGGTLTTIVFGRAGATGQMNISAGSVIFGALPTFGTAAANFINFTTGSTGTLTVTGANQTFYEGLFATQDLRYNGSFAGSFTDNFVVNGSTLSVVPEPSALLLGGLGLLAGLRRRR